ncbi:MAG: hypothetical protein RLZ55_1695 [Actinomycetota bacterium]
MSADAAAAPSDVSVATGDLVTHGVIVGMTGSGKTGLGIGLIEQTLSAGIPALLIDPKGDLTNLALAFPTLAGPEFEPWIDPALAKAAGQDLPRFAEAQAGAWREGLAPWGIGPDQMRAYKDSFGLTIYTPGSNAGVPLNVLGSLDAPQTDDSEAVSDEIEGYVTSLLSVVGIEADPVASREHILLSTLIANAWAAGESIDLPTLLARVQAPPMRKLGVFELDAFFPPADRMAFALRLNGVLAAPSFATWIAGDPIDIQRMLFGPDGTPRCAVITTSHLSDEQRQSAVSLILSKVVTWMRRQSGTTDLRALLYMDEVAGYLPPTANPPTKKPIMLLMKQARAFGLGVVLATQNPVDVDYKALSNAGTWMIGRLTTEQDKARLLDGMSSAAGGMDVKALSGAISALGKRQFLLRKAGRNDVETFSTRWVRSYLRGPMTRDQIARVKSESEAAQEPNPGADTASVGAGVAGSAGMATADPSASSPTGDLGPSPSANVTAPVTALADDETPVLPKIADGVPIAYLDPAAPWAAQAGAAPPIAGGQRLEPAVVARVIVRYDDARAGLSHDEEYEAVIHPLPASTAVLEPIVVDYDDRDLIAEAPAGARYGLAQARLDTKTYWTTLQRDLTDYLVRNKPIEVLVNPQLRAYSRVGETEEQFRQRCRELAEAEADKKTAALQTKYDAKLRTLQTRLDSAAQRADQLSSARTTGMIADAGSVLGGLFGGRRSSSAIAASVRRAGTANARAKDAAAKVDDVAAQIEDVEAELAGEVEAIVAEWQGKADDVQAHPVAAKKTNVRVTDLRLLWLPVA